MRVIIICGARRTGTTLMNQIVCADPGANAQVGEARLATQLLEVFSWANANWDNVVKWYFEDRDVYHTFFRNIVRTFLDNAVRALRPADKLVLKAPAFSTVIDEAMALLPNSEYLVCLRHPLDQVASDFEVGVRRMEQSGKAEGRAARRRMSGYARTYLNHYQKLLAAADREPDRFLFVRYEDLVAEPRATVRKIEQRLNLNLSAYDPEKPWKDFLNQEELSRAPAHVSQYGGPIDSSRAGRYHGILTADEVAEVSDICAPIIEEFYTG